ncbi:hypothetical protein EVAR_43692_1 [Eumeta japonica]|uniref:Uncharacterized protein n=1 Tax=Eumeta variegata TaxID=151549 RepID=A0A4C1WX15_EUMVA|nr:hypothetical protein EVAR_43692_1 [Eumeta japonica]
MMFGGGAPAALGTHTLRVVKWRASVFPSAAGARPRAAERPRADTLFTDTYRRERAHVPKRIGTSRERTREIPL